MKKILKLLLIIIIIFCGYKIVSKLINYHDANKAYNDIRKIETSKSETDKEKFESLKKINENYKFWITVQGTEIDYPVVQSTNNEYYLNHNFYNKKNDSGTLFVDYRDKIEKDRNIIIYGHNMKDGTMFENLSEFKDESFFNKNKYITLKEGEIEKKYEIFSVYIADDNFNYLVPTFKSDKEYESYLERMVKKSMYKRDISLSCKDKIITLSTCSYEFDDARFVVQAKEI
ncbi:class B sortase [Clostridium sp.]|uniref:class B sortase n=1 Tax=Clostridium sp. TaxID=1506 RepID=UPI002FC5F0A4